MNDYDRQCHAELWTRTVEMVDSAKSADASDLTDDELVEKIRDAYVGSNTRHGPDDADSKASYLRLCGFCAEARVRGKPGLIERGRQLARDFLGMNATAVDNPKQPD